MYRAIIFLLIGVCTTLYLKAQNKPVRFEIAVPAGSTPINFVPAANNGICVFYPTLDESGKDSVSWYFSMLNDKLSEEWVKKVQLHEDVTFLKSIATRDALYLLFHDTKRNKDGNIFVYMILPKLQLITEFRTSIPDKAEIVDFEISGNNAFMGYNNRKGDPGIVSFSFINGEKRTYPITSEKDALLLDVAIDTLRKEVYATYKIQYSATRNHLFVNKYNSPGALMSTFDFTGQVERRNFNTAQFLPSGDGTGIVTGTYGYNVTNSRRQYDYYDYYYNRYYNNYYSPYSYRQSNYDANNDKTPVSDGYFSAVIRQNQAGQVNYFSFGTFDNTVKYVTNASAVRFKLKSDRTQEEESPNQIEGTFNLRLLTHETVPFNGQYILVTEAYAPEYHTNTQMTYDYYGRSFPTSYQVFDGFRYSHAFIAAFDTSGIMTWNNGMEMRDILTKYLNRKLNCIFGIDETILFYNSNNKIAYKSVLGNQVLENTAYTSVPLKSGTDQAISEYNGTIQYWYDEFFIASGYQSIRNNFLEENKRNVFYISKLAFR
jgi:hypothetical protein